MSTIRRASKQAPTATEQCPQLHHLLQHQQPDLLSFHLQHSNSAQPSLAEAANFCPRQREKGKKRQIAKKKKDTNAFWPHFSRGSLSLIRPPDDDFLSWVSHQDAAQRKRRTRKKEGKENETKIARWRASTPAHDFPWLDDNPPPLRPRSHPLRRERGTDNLRSFWECGPDELRAE